MHIDRLAGQGDPALIAFPRPMLSKGLDFSFSGVKTAVRNHVRQNPVENENHLADIAAGFQEAIVDVLTHKTFRAAEEHDLERIVICGGVACNSGLRARMNDLAATRGRQVFFPSPALCADNAAMMAVAADHYLQSERSDFLALNAMANWSLDDAGIALTGG